MEIRTAQETDVDNIMCACLEEGWTTFGSRKLDFKEAINSSTLIVAYDNDTFAGFARALSDGYISTFLCELLVVKEYRMKGIGRMLVTYIRELFPATRMDLISKADAVYEKLGAKKVGTGYRIG